MEDVGKVANLVRRGAVYWCRMRCPQHLLRDCVPVEKSVSLGTKERSVALERLPAARLELMEFFQRGAKPGAAAPSGIVRTVQRLQRPDDTAIPLLTTAEAEKLAQEFFATAFEELDLASAGLIEMTPDRRADWQLQLEDRIKSLSCSSAQAEDPALGFEIALLRRGARRAPYLSQESRLFREYIRRALRQLWSLELARSKGDYRDRITDVMFVSRLSIRASSPDRRASPRSAAALLHRVRASFEESEIDADDAITDKTREKKKAALGLVERYFGRGCDLTTVTGAQCRAFRDLIGRLPPNLTKLFGGDVSLVEMADVSKARGGASMSYSTQALYLRLLDNLLAFARSEGLISTNPFPLGLRPRGRKAAREKARNGYSDDQLRAIFTSALYTGCVDDERSFAEPQPGNVIRRSRFWLPLIALFSGLRMNEILQLRKWHVQTGSDGLPCILINTDMQVKTAAGHRVVPMHRELIRCGLPAYIAGLREEDALLFDDVPPGPDGYASSTFSKRYATFWKSLNVAEAGRKVSFHSFRHNFRDALRLPGADEALVKELGGWSRGGSVSDSYGDGARAAVLRPIIDAVAYNLDLAHLHDTTTGSPG